MNAQNAPYSIYEKLLELPLFQGHSREDLTSMLTKIKVDFRNFKAGHEIVAQHDPCREILFLMDGDVVASRSSFLKDLLFVERFSAPHSFGVETLFGLQQNHTHSLCALTDVRMFVVDKAALVNQLFSFDVFRFNMLNTLSARLQRTNRLLWSPAPENITGDFLLMCKRNFTHHAGYKTIEGGMVSLARLMDRPRLQISNLLNAFEQRGLLSLSRKKIVIPQLEKLIIEATELGE